MQITVPKDLITSAFATCALAASTRSAVPAHAALQLAVAGTAADQPTLTVTAGDGSTFIRRQMPVDADVDGQVSVPAQLAADTVKNLTCEQVSLTVSDQSVQITGGTGRFTLNRTVVDGELQLPTVEGPSTAVDAARFAQHAKLVATAASKDVSKPALNGVRLESDDGTMTLVATDAYRLSSSTLASAGDAVAALLPVAVVPAFVKVFDQADKLTITASAAAVHLVADDTEMVVSQIADQFPDWRKLTATTPPATATVDTASFQAALKRVSRYGDTVQVNFDPAGELTVSSGTDAGNASETVAAAFDHPEPVTVKFAGEVLAAGLATTDTRKVTLKLADTRTPVWLVGDDRLYLAVPRP